MATVWGNRGCVPAREGRTVPRPAIGRPSRVQVDRFVAALRLSALALPVLLLLGMFAVLATRGSAAFDPSFWFTSATGAAGGGVSDQILGTLLLVVTCGLIALPLGFGAGVLLGVHASARTARVLQTLTVVPGAWSRSA
ncbi:Phosphate transport system permease protein OS=Streptomyces microflavus OX=1919 GN=Smic_01410 PE=3 SV=1 [Streptomyces microflavus]